jgi:hypothetical protein
VFAGELQDDLISCLVDFATRVSKRETNKKWFQKAPYERAYLVLNNRSVYRAVFVRSYPAVGWSDRLQATGIRFLLLKPEA